MCIETFHSKKKENPRNLYSVWKRLKTDESWVPLKDHFKLVFISFFFHLLYLFLFKNKKRCVSTMIELFFLASFFNKKKHNAKKKTVDDEGLMGLEGGVFFLFFLNYFWFYFFPLSTIPNENH